MIIVLKVDKTRESGILLFIFIIYYLHLLFTIILYLPAYFGNKIIVIEFSDKRVCEVGTANVGTAHFFASSICTHNSSIVPDRFYQ